jgi:hypothetical protein
VHTHTGQEDGSLANQNVTGINTFADDDIAGIYGMSRHGDKAVYTTCLMDIEYCLRKQSFTV